MNDLEAVDVRLWRWDCAQCDRTGEARSRRDAHAQRAAHNEAHRQAAEDPERRRDELIEDVLIYLTSGESLRTAAWRHGVKPDSLAQALRRIDRTDLLIRLRRNEWRRVA